MAKPEKAILDFLYLRSDIHDQPAFEALRWNKDLLSNLDFEKLHNYTEWFDSPTLSRKVQWLKNTAMLELSQIKKFYPETLQGFERLIIREYLQYQILRLLFNGPHSHKLTFLGELAFALFMEINDFRRIWTLTTTTFVKANSKKSPPTSPRNFRN